MNQNEHKCPHEQKLGSVSVSTLWQGKQSMPGNSSRSPVRALKQEPCHGQRNLFPDKMPEHTHVHDVYA